MRVRVVALAGGTGSSKLLRGLQYEHGDFTVVSNVGDNFWNHGLYVCPDTDTAMYTLAGEADVARGWGLSDESFHVLAQLRKLGEETWFNLGDRDLATHIFRTEQIARGKKLGDVTSMLCGRFKVKQRILPCTDDKLETHIDTELGKMHLQEFWVKNRGEPKVTGVEYRGAEGARAEQPVLAAIEGADRIIFCPGNPVTSIMPILAVQEVRRALEASKARRIAVSPMIGSAPISGPAGKLMQAIGAESTSTSVAQLYQGIVDTIVVDRSDAGQMAAIESGGLRAVASSILMNNREEERRLAKLVLES